MTDKTDSKEREALVAYLKDCDAHDIVPDVGGAWHAAFQAGRASLAANAGTNCERCGGSGEDPEGFYDQSRGDAGHTHDGPCRACDGSGVAASAGSEPVESNRPSLESVFRGLSDRAYCNYIEQMRRNECLGWEHKVKHGTFGEAELKAHTLAGRLLGRHHAFAEAANALRGSDAPLTHPSPPEGMVGGWISVEDVRKPPPGKPVVFWVWAERYQEDDDGRQIAQDASGLHLGEWREAEHGNYFDNYSTPFADREAVLWWMDPTPPTTSAGSGKGE